MANKPRPSLRAADGGITFGWFEREALAATPQAGILDAASLGIWSVAEQSGRLAGEWRRHRNLMQDLDVTAVSAALGDLLTALAQTAHAIGLPLDTVAQQQIARLQAQPRTRPSAPPNATSRGAPHTAPADATQQRSALLAPPTRPHDEPVLISRAKGVRSRATREQGSPGEPPLAQSARAAQAPTPAPTVDVTRPAPTRRPGRPRKTSLLERTGQQNAPAGGTLAPPATGAPPTAASSATPTHRRPSPITLPVRLPEAPPRRGRPPKRAVGEVPSGGTHSFQTNDTPVGTPRVGTTGTTRTAVVSPRLAARRGPSHASVSAPAPAPNPSPRIPADHASTEQPHHATRATRGQTTPHPPLQRRRRSDAPDAVESNWSFVRTLDPS